MLAIIALITAAIFFVFLCGAAGIDKKHKKDRRELGDDEDFLFFLEEDMEDER